MSDTQSRRPHSLGIDMKAFPDDNAGKMFFLCSFSSSCVLIVAVPDVRITAVSCDEESEYQALHFLAAVLIRRIRKPLFLVNLCARHQDKLGCRPLVAPCFPEPPRADIWCNRRIVIS